MDSVCIKMYGRTIQNIKSEKHLGHLISSRGSLVNLEPVMRDMKVRTNAIIHQFTLPHGNLRCCCLIAIVRRCMVVSCGILISQELRSWVWRGECVAADCLLCTLARALPAPYYELSFCSSDYWKKNAVFFIRGMRHPERQISQFFRNVLLSNSSYMLSNMNSILQSYNIKYYEIFYCNINYVIGKVCCLEDYQYWQT